MLASGPPSSGLMPGCRVLGVCGLLPVFLFCLPKPGVTKPERLEGGSGRPGRSLEQVVSAGMSQPCLAKEGRMERGGAERSGTGLHGDLTAAGISSGCTEGEARVGHEGRLIRDRGT